MSSTGRCADSGNPMRPDRCRVFERRPSEQLEGQSVGNSSQRQWGRTDGNPRSASATTQCAVWVSAVLAGVRWPRFPDRYLLGNVVRAARRWLVTPPAHPARPRYVYTYRCHSVCCTALRQLPYIAQLEYMLAHRCPLAFPFTAAVGAGPIGPRFALWLGL